MTTTHSDHASKTRPVDHKAPTSMVERVTLILDAFDGPMSHLSLETVATRSGLPRSTVHRILDQLVERSWVDRARSGYLLGRRALELDSDNNGHNHIRSAAAPLLHHLHMQTGMVVHLSVLDGGDVVYLDKVGGRLASMLYSRVGGRTPAYSTAGGKAMLAWVAPETVDNMYSGGLKRFTDRTIGDLMTLHHELNRIRQRRGLTFEQGEAMRRISCVGVAIRHDDTPLASISMCGEVGTAQLERVAPLVIDAARTASHTLGTERNLPREHQRTVRTLAGSWSTQMMNQQLATASDQWL